jgi:hypothetical protein
MQYKRKAETYTDPQLMGVVLVMERSEVQEDPGTQALRPGKATSLGVTPFN